MSEDSKSSLALARWRAILGTEAKQQGIEGQGDPQLMRAGELLDFLYQEQAEKASGERGADNGPSTGYTVSAWVNEVAELFPRSVKEVMERELVRRRGIGPLLSDPELLERIEPSPELVKTLLTHRDLIRPETRALVRKIVAEVVEQIAKKLRLSSVPSLMGAIRRDRHSSRRVFKNLDLRTTLRRNLQHWDRERQRLLVDRLFFHAAERNERPWHVIVAVDQSGSMLDSAIYSCVMASIFASIPAFRTSLFLFDTRVLDLSAQVGAPVDVLLSIQLGGGTDIAMAMAYAGSLVREPQRTIIVLVTDFFEGGDASKLVRHVADLSTAGVRLVGLGALGYDCTPQIDRALAKRCTKAGMDVLTCTPERLSEAIGAIIGR